MKRHWVIALLALSLYPGLARAQDDGPNWGPLIRITPFLGVSPNLNQSGEAVVVSSTAVDIHSYDLKYGSSLPVGATIELRFWNRFGLVVGGAWSARGNGELRDGHDNSVYQVAGTNLLLAKAGLAIHLNEVRPEMQWRRMNGTIFIAPALIRDAPKDPPFAPVLANVSVDHMGLNLGAEGELPMTSKHLAFTIGFEDWLIFWNNEDYIPRIGAYIEQRTPSQTVVSVEPKTTHLWILRAGLSFRF